VHPRLQSGASGRPLNFAVRRRHMNSAVLRGLLALAGASVFLTVSEALFVMRRDLASALLATGIGWFGVMALTHVFESFSILPAFGWGRPHSVGHFIDLAAASLGVLFVTTGFLVHRRMATSNNRWRGP
jgi:hypothetical protein